MEFNRIVGGRQLTTVEIAFIEEHLPQLQDAIDDHWTCDVVDESTRTGVQTFLRCVRTISRPTNTSVSTNNGVPPCDVDHTQILDTPKSGVSRIGDKTPGQKAGSLLPMGNPSDRLDPALKIEDYFDMGDRSAYTELATRTALETLGSAGGSWSGEFSDLPSVRSMTNDKNRSVVVGFDTEFYYPPERGGDPRVLSLQTVTVSPDDPGSVVCMTLIPLTDGDRPQLESLLFWVFESAGLWGTELCDVPASGVDDRSLGVTRAELIEQFESGAVTGFYSAAAYADYEITKRLFKAAPAVTLVYHWGMADLDMLYDSRGLYAGSGVDIKRRVTSAGGGLVSRTPVRVDTTRPEVVRGSHRRFPFRVTLRDTVALSVADRRSLDALGAVCGVSKGTALDDLKSCMDVAMRDHLVEFLAYGAQDALICLSYLALVFGDHSQPPLTISSAAARAVVDIGFGHFDVDGKARGGSAAFYESFAGLRSVTGDTVMVESSEKLSFYDKRGKEPLNFGADVVTRIAAHSYGGGLNACIRPGFYRLPTYDVDFSAAYPTMMTLVPDIDWVGGAVERYYKDVPITLDDVPTINVPVFVYGNFEFPDDTRFPCIPVNIDGVPMNPLRGDGVYMAGPEIHAALKLGARIHAIDGVRCLVRRDGDGRPSFFLAHAVQQLVRDRRWAKEVYGSGSLQEKLLKIAVNSIYGKTAQDVSEHRGWDAYAQEMDDVGGSSITSPVHASMTTSLMRAVLCLVSTEIESAGHRVYSYTTDGLITDMPVDEVEGLPLAGSADLLRVAKSVLVPAGEDVTLWEEKHRQNGLLNFTTRGNTSLELGGVNAHNSAKTEHPSDSHEDRHAMYQMVLGRLGKVSNPTVRFTSFQEVSRVENRLRFKAIEQERYLSMDFDCKREPIAGTMVNVSVLFDGSVYEIATFDTKPWADVDAFERGRECAQKFKTVTDDDWDSRPTAVNGVTGALRTIDDWGEYFTVLSTGRKRRVKDVDRLIMLSVLMAVRMHGERVPNLSSGTLSVAAKVRWLSSWGVGNFRESDWKNARRKSRIHSMLPLEKLTPVIEVMRRVTDGRDPVPSEKRHLAVAIESVKKSLKQS